MQIRTIFITSPLVIISFLNHIWVSGSMYQTHTSSMLGPSDHREAYFNGSSYVRLLTTISLQRHTGLSFRTCKGGELFSQQYGENLIAISVTKNGLEFLAATAAKRYETTIVAQLLDNRWHTVDLEYRLGNLTLSVDEHTQLIANKSFNSEFLTNSGLSNEGSILIVGKQYTGCILEGPSIVFNFSFIHPHDTFFGPCPIPMNDCSGPLELVQTRKEDHCSHEPCMLHGTCVSRADRYECHCTPRYSGNNCEFDNGSPCKRAVCANGATCVEDNRGDYICVCPPGFNGKRCEIEVQIHPQCSPDPCLNNGTCRVLPGTNIPDCLCAPGFAGPLCETDLNECQPNPCQNGGLCVDGPNNYTCLCSRTGYEGTNCEINVNECLMNPCLHHGVCFDTYGSYVCHCQEGFDGQNCELNLNECVSMPCQNRGSCIDRVGGYECLCPPGYSGSNCELFVCDGIACPSYAECKEQKTGYRCVCKAGYTGIYPNCTEAGAACLSSPCLNGGTCTASLDSFNCTCPPGFEGSLCEDRVSLCAHHQCQNGASCVETAMSYECICADGFAGPTCERSVQCSDNPCQHATSCQDFLGGYYCTCAPGWTGPECDIHTDPCFSEPPPCLNGATCVAALGRPYCRCTPGFTGKKCETNSNECNSQPCLNGGTCIDKVNGFFCNCTNDFMGAICERPYDVCEFKPCKNNASCSSVNKHDFECDCLPGFSGVTCEVDIDECQHIKCSEGRVCKDLIAGYECRCPDGYTGENCSIPIDPCAKTFCQNSGTCIVNQVAHGFTCACPPGFTGTYCEQDIDECNTTGVPLCTHGICVNKHGGFQCYCMPGYTGETCSLDFDECLSQPCKFNSTCLNKINNYECICTPGYTGKNCDEEINECESSPCYAGSTCEDDIASFRCICQAGFTGQLCDTNIDDCQSSPCLNEGLCIDGLNDYTCNCSDTGYSGTHCEINIDDCLSNPCSNGAQCVDGVKDYMCQCYPGYIGKNCEIDVDECSTSPCQNFGTCLQRSNLTLYDSSSNNNRLPDIFLQPFSFENASGYECICIEGVTGKDCETDINECDSSPCQKGGTCRNKIGGYSCECEEGTEGKHCEIDINECERYTPCMYGTCIDLKANYYCECPPKFGGKNCSVELIGCEENPCKNNGTCKPYLENEIHHKFNCSCTYGYHGETCEKITTMSLSGQSYIAVNTSRDEGYDIQFRFKTTLGDGLLAIGKGLTYYILELVHGRLNLHSSLLNKWEGVFIGSGLNDSKWQKVFVAINSSHLVLAANEEQTIYPINLNEGSNPSHTSFPTTYLGGTISELRRLTHGPSAFVGCTEDVIINGEWVLPQNTSWMSLVDVEVGCSRTPQCNPNPCHSGGRCTDKWRSFSCTCERPYLGHTCQYNYTAATFGYENITNSLVTVSVTEAARRAVRSIVDISMFIRTRQSVGQIFYLGSTLSGTNYNDDNHISAKLEAGELLVSILFNGTPESYTVSGVKLDNGFNHLIEVIRNVTLVQVKLNGTEYFRKTISGTGQLDAQVLYLGGLPEVKRPVRQTDISGMKMDTTTSSSGPAAITSPSVNFKGIIQDVQISNGSRRMVVQFFPLDVPDLEIPIPFGKVSFDNSTLMEGVISDDLCRTNPCEHGGTCSVTWNDFRCHCTIGFKGKTCSELEFCQLKDCPTGSECRNLEDGYECIANATFNGKTKPLIYDLEIPPAVQYYPIFETIEIKYRTKTGGTIMYVQNDPDYFFVFVDRDEVTVQWSLFGRPESYRFSKDNTAGDWNTLYFAVKDIMFYGGFRELVFDDSPSIVVNDFNTTSFNELFIKGKVFLGGSERKSYDFLSLHNKYKKYNTTSYITNNSVTETNAIDITTNSHTTDQPIAERYKDKFKGCLGEVRIGELLLPYFMTSEIYSNNNISREYFSLYPESEHSVGCRVCFDDDCSHNGRCLDAEASYQCNCAPGYTAEDCSVDIDECMENKCQNNSTCIDGIANFTCECASGYEGWLCDSEINECLSSPCRNGGTCIDLLANYECTCTEDYVGRQCEALRLITCENQPCRNGSTCENGINVQTGNNFTCSCTKGMVGALCDTPFCIAEPCKHGLCNVSSPEPVCVCDRGYSGRYCEEDINDCILASGESPCQHGGLCLDEVDKYSCNCTGTGYKGLLCELDVDECEDEYICGKNGRCVNMPGSFRCVCPEGMCGIYCAIPDPCQTDPCGEHGFCNYTCTSEPSYNCECFTGYYGTYCNETVVSQSSNDASISITLIVIPIVAIILLGGAAGLAVLLAMARSKRATRGTYSPSAQEFCNPRVELDHVLKPPPEERLI